MKIKNIKIENYRNFGDKINIEFNEDVNFIIGENNFGKSNLLKIFYKIFNCNSSEMFEEEDFNDKEKEIVVILTLRLNRDEELGIFEDNFDIENDFAEINIELRQEFDEEVQIKCLDSNTELKIKDLKKFNLFYLDSSKNKNTHLDFDKKIDINSTLNLLLEYSLKDIKTEVNGNLEKIKEFEKLNELLENLNNHFSKLHVPSNHDIQIEFNNLEDIISKIFILKEKTGIDFKRSGEGLKSLLYLELIILHKLFVLKKKEKLSERFDNIILIDEPEIHLHTYKQRNFIKYLINNFKFDKSSQGNEFKNLITDIFNIETFDSQIFIVTHSPNIITDNYKQLIRFYKKNNKICVISGVNIEINKKEKLKHFLRQKKDIKECLFSKGVIINEGETEVGAFDAFFELKKIDKDKFGIDVISVNGTDNIEPIKEILEFFEINTIGIKDKDLLTPEQIINFENNEIFITENKEFEIDFVQNLDENYFYTEVIKYEFEDFLKKSFLLDFKKIVDSRELSSENKEKLIQIMLKHKNSVLGYLFGKTSKTVPKIYNEAIDRILEKIIENE